jgi:hypothetical protein
MPYRIIPALIGSALLMVTTISTGVAVADQTYSRPLVMGSLVDHCVTWGRGCGQPGADNFCRMKGYVRATYWQTAPRDVTLVLGSNRQCQDRRGSYSCLGFDTVTCTDTQLDTAAFDRFCIDNPSGDWPLYIRVDEFGANAGHFYIYEIFPGNRQHFNRSDPGHACSGGYVGTQHGCQGRYFPLPRCPKNVSDGSGGGDGAEVTPEPNATNRCRWTGPGKTNCKCEEEPRSDFWCALYERP